MLTLPIRVLAVLLVACLLPSCATIINSGPDLVPVNTEPEGARVKLDGQPVGITPMTVAFPRKAEGVLTFELAGYETRELDVDKVAHGWIFGNILIGGLIGVMVDFITSNQGKYSTDAIYIELMPDTELFPEEDTR